MASTTFNIGTVIPVAWCNEVNAVVWTLFGGSASASNARVAIGLGATITGTGNTVLATSPTLTTPTWNGTANGFDLTLSSPLGVASGGTGVQTSTGTVNVVLSNSPTLVTPVIGAATGTSLLATGSLTTTGATGGIGYRTGAGGTVTQATSKVTAFTLSKLSGTIQFAADALGADTTTAGATWTNTTIAATDVVVFNHISGGTLGAYNITCTPAAGSATVRLRNVTPGSLSEAPVFSFAVIKAVIT